MMNHASSPEIVPLSMQDGKEKPHDFADRLGASFRRFGFAIIKDHGLDPAVIARAQRASENFFALPLEAKARYHLPGTGGARGYTPFGTEAAKDASSVDLKEFWHMGRTLPAGHPHAAVMPPNLWPSEIPDFAPALCALWSGLEQIGQSLLSAIARHLSLPADFFEAPTHDGNSVLRLLHYPPVDADAPGVRAGAHEDINVITLLLGAEEAGLELRERSTGQWLALNPPPGTLVVNIGDMLQRLSNNVLPSTTHRVVNPPVERRGHARHSMPFFLHFAPDYLIRTLPGCISNDNPDRYPQSITANAYLLERLREIRLL